MYRSCRKHSISLHTICTVNKLLFATRQRAAGLTPAFITQRHAPKEQINEEPKTKTYARNFTLWNSYDTLPSRQMKTKRLPNIIFYHRTICGTSFNVAHMLFRSYFFCRSWPEIMFFNAGGTVPCYASTSLGFKSHGTVACHEAIRFVTRTAECFTRNMASRNSFVQPDYHFHALVLKQIYHVSKLWCSDRLLCKMCWVSKIGPFNKRPKNVVLCDSKQRCSITDFSELELDTATLIAQSFTVMKGWRLQLDIQIWSMTWSPGA